MADLLAKQEKTSFNITRGQELTGEVITITPQEIILDLGTKAEGVLPKRDLGEELKNLKVGDKLQVFVVIPENESGQVVLAARRVSDQGGPQGAKWDKFFIAQKEGKSLLGKGIEINRGGLIVEVGGIRGFLPSSQVSLSQAENLEELIGKDVNVTIIEADPSQNRLIFSQKTKVTDEIKENLNKLSIGDKVKGKVAAVLPFGIFVTLDNGVEGLVHVSEIAWEKVDDPAKYFKLGMEVEALVISIDPNTNRVNLSVKQLQDDPFLEISKKYSADDVVKGTVSKVTSNGVGVSLEGGAEGLIPTSKIEQGTEYQVGQEIQCLVDSVDITKRRIYLAPLLTSTKGLIYK